MYQLSEKELDMVGWKKRRDFSRPPKGGLLEGVTAGRGALL